MTQATTDFLLSVQSTAPIVYDLHTAFLAKELPAGGRL